MGPWKILPAEQGRDEAAAKIESGGLRLEQRRSSRLQIIPFCGGGIVPDWFSFGHGYGPVEQVADVGEDFAGGASCGGDALVLKSRRRIAQDVGGAVGEGGQGVAEQWKIGGVEVVAQGIF